MEKAIQRLIRWFQRTVAYWKVRMGRAERICAPGLWVVWRDEAGVRVRVMS